MGHGGIIVEKVSVHPHAVKLAALPMVPERTQTPDPNTHALGSPMGRQTRGEAGILALNLSRGFCLGKSLRWAQKTGGKEALVISYDSFHNRHDIAKDMPVFVISPDKSLSIYRNIFSWPRLRKVPYLISSRDLCWGKSERSSVIINSNKYSL